MAVSLNHTIVPTRDKRASAAFLAKILGLPVDKPFGPFVPLHIGESLTLDFADVDFAHRGTTDIAPHHYAFQVDEAEFDEIFHRIVEGRRDYYAEFFEDPGYTEIYTWRGGRAVYFDDP